MHVTRSETRKTAPRTLSGSCLCGGVQFEITAPMRPVISCYCSECRKTSGNYVNATGVPKTRFRLLADESLRWYQTDLAARGFCGECGGNLFWEPVPADGDIRIMAGCLQPDNGLAVAAHIFVQDKSDFHRVPDDVPHFTDWNYNIPIPR